MTEKRFEMVIVDIQGNFYYLDRVTDEKINSTLALEDKLNELADENEQLKKENTNLRVELDTHKHPLWSTREAERIINELKDENKQLKEKITELASNNKKVIKK